MESEEIMPKKPAVNEVARMLEEIGKIPICSDCDVLRGANIFAQKYYGSKGEKLFQNNLDRILTTHVDLGCQPCPVDEVMKLFRKNRLAAIAAMF